MTKNNHIYFILQFDPLKHSINNSSCNLTYTPQKIINNAHEWVAQFRNKKRERLISLMVLDKYFRLTGQY